MDILNNLKKWMFLTGEDFHKHLLGMGKDCENYSHFDTYFVAYFCFLLPIVASSIYYLLLDNYRFTDKWWWFVVGVVSLIINTLILYSFIRPLNSACEELNVSNLDVTWFLIVDFIWAFFIYFIASIFFKRFSKNHTNIPF